MRQQTSLQLATDPTLPTTPTVSQETAFGEYLKRSLRVIGGERHAQIESQGSGIVGKAVPAQPSDSQSQGQSSGGVIERVFVPMLQPGSGANQGSPSNLATAPSLPAPNAGTTSQSNGTTSIPNVAVANRYELVGVLELGDRSAALFEINGSSQRVYIGETIGASGWSIVSIDNEEVVVRRNGEIRSIYIGQQF